MSSFEHIPEVLRYPGVYIEIDGSKAGLGEDIPKMLIVGQRLATGTAVAGEIVRISSVEDAATKAGLGSQLHQMFDVYRNLDKVLDIFMLPLADNPAGAFADGTITVNTEPTETGTLSLYIGAKRISVGVVQGEAVATVAANIAAAINAKSPLESYVTATSADGVVTVTAKHKGTTGNDIDVRLGLYGEPMPAGLTLSVTALTGGTGNPDIGDLETIMGQKWYRYVALGFADKLTLDVWHDESSRRYQPPVQAGFRAFCAHRGGYDNAATFGEAGNFEHIACLPIAFNPTPTWEVAAMLAAAAAPRLNNNPVNGLEGVELRGMVGVEYFTWTQSNSLLFKGMSALEVGDDGSCYIKRLISMYTKRSDGSADSAWLDINAAERQERFRLRQRMEGIKAFRGKVAAKSDENFRPGLDIVTEDSVTALYLGLYKNVFVRQLGWCQNYDHYKGAWKCWQDPDNPSRFNFTDQPVFNSPFYIAAGKNQFLTVAPE